MMTVTQLANTFVDNIKKNGTDTAIADVNPKACTYNFNDKGTIHLDYSDPFTLKLKCANTSTELAFDANSSMFVNSVGSISTSETTTTATIAFLNKGMMQTIVVLLVDDSEPVCRLEVIELEEENYGVLYPRGKDVMLMEIDSRTEDLMVDEYLIYDAEGAADNVLNTIKESISEFYTKTPALANCVENPIEGKEYILDRVYSVENFTLHIRLWSNLVTWIECDGKVFAITINDGNVGDYSADDLVFTLDMSPVDKTAAMTLIRNIPEKGGFYVGSCYLTTVVDLYSTEEVPNYKFPETTDEANNLLNYYNHTLNIRMFPAVDLNLGEVVSSYIGRYCGVLAQRYNVNYPAVDFLIVDDNGDSIVEVTLPDGVEYKGVAH